MIGKTISHCKILEKLHQKDIERVGEDGLEVVLKFENISRVFLNIIQRRN